MLRAPREPGLLIEGEWALLSIWGFIQDSWRAEAAPLPVAGWNLELTSCVLQPGRSRQQYFTVSPEAKTHIRTAEAWGNLELGGNAQILGPNLLLEQQLPAIGGRFLAAAWMS